MMIAAGPIEMETSATIYISISPNQYAPYLEYSWMGLSS